MYNKLLQQQIQKYFGALKELPEGFIPLLQVISNTYDHYEKNSETIELNNNLRREIKVLENAEKKLIASEARLKEIIDLVPHFIFAKDINGKFILVNKAVADVYGVTTKDLIGKSDADFNANAEEIAHFAAEDLKVIQSGKEQINQEEVITDTDGNVRILSTTKIPFIASGVDGPALLGVSVDISDRKKIEKELEKSFSILEATIESTADGILVTDFDGKIIKFNKRFAELWRIPEEILVTGDDKKALSFVLDQLAEPDEFVSVIKDIYIKKTGQRFDILHFKDGRVFERYSQPHMIKGNCVGRVWSFRDITARKFQEEALSKSESLFRTLTVNAPVGIFQTDADGKTTYVNETWLRYADLELNEALGKDWKAIVHPDDHESVVEEWNNKSKKGLTSSLEYRVINKKGNIRWVSGETIPLFNNDREITGYIGTLSDITERKKADEALRLAQFTIENITHAIYWIKSDSSFHMVNNAATQMLGFTFDELMERNVPGIDPLYDKDVWDGFWQALIKEKNIRLITKHIRKDGTLLDVQIDTHYFKFEDLEMSCAFVSDITERKRAETLLKNSEERYRQIVETAQEGIWLIDENDNTSFINKKMCEIVGYSAEELMAKKMYDFMNEQSRKNALEQIERSRRGRSEIHDAVFVTKSGKLVWVSISPNPVFDDNGKYKGTLAMMTNITQRKLHEDLLRQSEANLELKNKELELKNKELEQFAYVASHDLQEPLRTISNFTELIQKKYNGQLDNKADSYFNYIHQSSERMRVLIKDLLDYSRIGRAHELQEVNCEVVLKETLADLAMAINESHTQVKSCPLPVIKGYPTEIKQLFQNLITNAIKFRKKDISPEIEIFAEKREEYWEFKFKDNGIGIDEKHSEKIFIIFQRLHNRSEYEGSGIGLAHCKKIVESHGGRIWLESEPGKGAIFYFTIKL